jgi:hypothetical protein
MLSDKKEEGCGFSIDFLTFLVIVDQNSTLKESPFVERASPIF